MLDIKFIRENKDLIIAGAKKKHLSVDIERLLALDDSRRELSLGIDQKRAEQNTASAQMTQASKEEREKIIARMQEVKETLRLAEESLASVMEEWRRHMLEVPNIPDISVPEGSSDADNQPVRFVGEPTRLGNRRF
jgi:seryl-tRNA synthetase